MRRLPSAILASWLLFGAVLLATSASDDFNRANGGIGGDWTTQQGTELQIASNVVVSGTDNSTRTAFWTAGTWSDDQSCQFTQVSTGASFSVGCTVRASLTGASSVYYLLGVSDVDGFAVLKRVGGVLSTVSGSPSGTSADGSVMRLEVSGTTLEVFDDDVSLGTCTDSDIASGNPGIWSRGDGVNASLDNWSAADLGGGAATPRRLTLLGVGEWSQ